MNPLFILLVFIFEKSFGNIIRTFKLDSQVTVHQFIGQTLIDVSSYVIELPTKLVIFDAQFVLSDANELLTLTKTLRKPIDRIVISPAHPDHHLGSDVFKNIAPIYALEETIREISSTSQFTIANLKQNLPGIIPTLAVFPNKNPKIC